MKFITLLMLIFISKTFKGQFVRESDPWNDTDTICVFKTHNDCLSQPGCCRVYLNEEFMCLGKSVLFRDYNKMLAANFGDGDDLQDEKVQAVDDSDEIDICPKWIEANDVFFADTTLKYSCECTKHIDVFFTGIAIFIAWILAF